MKGAGRSRFLPNRIELASPSDSIVKPKLGETVSELVSDGGSLAELEGQTISARLT